MTENNFQTLEELEEQLIELKLKIAMTELAGEETDDLYRQLDQDAGFQKEARASQDRLRPRIYRLIDRELRKQRTRHITRHVLPKAVNIAAAVVLLLSVSFSTAFAVSPTVRMRVLQFIIRTEEKYSELSLQEDIGASIDVPEEWVASLYPTYLPEGYELVHVLGLPGNMDAVFRNAENKLLTFSENGEDVVMQVDTEGAQLSDVQIRNHPATLVEKGNTATLFWFESGCYYAVQVDGDAQLAKAVAEGLARINR